jgi:hypothetical protein
VTDRAQQRNVAHGRWTVPENGYIRAVDSKKKSIRRAQTSVQKSLTHGARARKFIIAFTRARYRCLSWANWIHSTPLANLPKINCDPIFPSTPRSSEWSLSFWFPHQNLVHFSLLFDVCHMPRPPQWPWLDLPNDIWGWVQIMKLLNVQLPQFSCYFIPLRSKYSP